jgi:hypothetical protein
VFSARSVGGGLGNFIFGDFGGSHFYIFWAIKYITGGSYSRRLGIRCCETRP